MNCVSCPISSFIASVVPSSSFRHWGKVEGRKNLGKLITSRQFAGRMVPLREGEIIHICLNYYRFFDYSPGLRGPGRSRWKAARSTDSTVFVLYSELPLIAIGLSSKMEKWGSSSFRATVDCCLIFFVSITGRPGGEWAVECQWENWCLVTM